MATEGSIGLSQPVASTITMSLRTVVQAVNSSNVHQEVMTIGGAESTLEIARVINATPSTQYGLVTRSLIYDSGDVFGVRSGSTGAVDYMPVRIVDSSGTGFAPLGLDYTDNSTTSTLAAPGLAYNNGSNTTMRVVGITQPWPVQIRTGGLSYQSTTTFITSTNSSAVYNLVSSVAGQAVKVFAVAVFSTHTRPSTMVFMSSGGANSGADVWGGQFGSGSSGVTGWTQAVAPPGFLFQTAAGDPLRVRIEEGSTAANSTTQARVSISYFIE